MKKIFAFVLACMCMTTLVCAQNAATPASTNEMLKGTIIDNMCASSQKPEALAAFVKTHTKECALMSACAASGYSLFTDGKLVKFDKASSAKIEEFLKKTGSKLAVTVEAKKVRDELSLISIKNQE